MHILIYSRIETYILCHSYLCFYFYLCLFLSLVSVSVSVSFSDRECLDPFVCQEALEALAHFILLSSLFSICVSISIFVSAFVCVSVSVSVYLSVSVSFSVSVHHRRVAIMMLPVSSMSKHN